MQDGNLSVLIVAAKWWPLSARLASAFVKLGCHVTALCPAGHPLAHVGGIRRLVHYRGTDPVRSLQHVLEDSHADVVIPCDDTIVAQLHGLHARHERSPVLRGVIERSLGPAHGYPIVDSRHELLSAARRLGIRVPVSARIGHAEDLERWHRAVPAGGVLKADLTSGGNGVRISHSFAESVAAWHDLTRPIDWPIALKRLLVDRDPAALWDRREQGHRGITIQEFVPGRPANSMIACHRGAVVAIASVSVVVSDGAIGAATVVRTVDDDEMTRAAELLARELELSGFFGLDFMLDAATGRPWLVEMNPRCTQLGHLELLDRGSLASALHSALTGLPRAAVGEMIRAETIAFFPQARLAPRQSSGAATTHHDVPWDEPGLIAELLAPPLPQRRLLSRLYHAVRPLHRSLPVAHESIARLGLETS